MNQTIDTLAKLAADLSDRERALLLDALGVGAPASPEDSLALVGIGCRLPGGADDPEALWALLEAGRDAVDRIPDQRWDADALFSPNPEARGRSVTRYGAFLSDIEGFDPRPFDLTEVEAGRMDPQQRLLLEVAHEALEDAGLAPDRLRGQPVGVFVGSCGHDFEVQRSGPADVHTLTGVLSSVLAGRISHAFGFEGPSLTVDTACSSSLVALHLARASLLRGECSLALVAGVNLMLSPTGYDRLSRARALSPDGRCRTFDAQAKGYARGEGVGVVVLTRLADARRRADRIWAVVAGSAVNHDGRSASLTAPSGARQRAVIEAALASARPTAIRAAELDYVEAHGTGTPLGDPIEVEALREVLGPRDQPCVIGSIKTNLGHLEGAAGVVGLIKVALSLTHEQIPRHLHFEQLNPRIDLGGAVEIAAAARPWPRGPRRRIAGVSGFGISGTNAHVILCEAPEAAAEAEASGPRGSAAARAPVVLPLAGHDREALGELARRYAACLAELDAAALPGFAAAAATRRGQSGLRVAVSGRDPRALAQALLDAALPEPGRAPPRLVVLRDPSFDAALCQRWASWAIPCEAELALGDRGGVEAALAELGAGPLILVIGGQAPEWLGERDQLRACPDLDALFELLAELHGRGVEIDWSAVYPGPVAHVSLPPYPWQRRRFALDAPAPVERVDRDPRVDELPRRGHPRFGEARRVATAPGLRVWQAELDLARDASLGALRVAGVPVVSAALTIEAALAAALALGRAPALSELQFEAELELDRPRELQLIVDLEVDSFELFAREGEGEGAWRRHASGRLAEREAERAAELSVAELEQLRARASVHAGSELYERRAAVEHGPELEAIAALWIDGDQRLAELERRASASEIAALDAALQVLSTRVGGGGRGRVVAIEHVEVDLPLRSPSSIWARAETRADELEPRVRGELRILDAEGRVLGSLRGCVAAPPADSGPVAPTIPAEPARLRELVLAATREILGLDPKLVISPEQDLRELGMDSLLSFELADRLSDLIGVRLDDGFSADYPSVAAMVEALVELARGDGR
ncbi:Phenolphthiocerol synthesis polyketide synthase type I Pks15/1 [Enhygromyxa salina]|uniref:Phenolphthiocerol synthesis polyketide synthase type I Pks15/1 n=1 Tax=Enhygromyxa salina TaxID=215803 RepID=A0A2S9YGD1_9BACT|nr:beta-ketoacyl synthase N-terminal-like domain-containing protein [Enhygromyxa salina]PRQ04167.1 Phenolphthiocerol synthesis polyketide synthase type I Pks15/1 [Enhygromyxa salina]